MIIAMSYHYSPQYTALYLRRESFARYSGCNLGLPSEWKPRLFSGALVLAG